MTVFRAQVVLPYSSGLPTDVVTNTWHFENLTGATMPTVAADIMPRIEAFYESLYITTRSMANYIDEAAVHVNWYDLSQLSPRVPLTLPMPLTVSSNRSIMPAEVSVVLSFQGAFIPGGNRARRRGRIYIGALGNGWQDPSSVVTNTLVAPDVLTAMAGLAEQLGETVFALGHRWVVWSPTDQIATIINNGWIDNTFDTQRRRGIASTQRQTYTVAPP